MTDHDNRRFSKAHVWVKRLDDHLLLGITEYAENALGAIEFIDLPDIGKRIRKDETCGTLESVKTVSDLIAPLDATVTAHNDRVEADPALINDDPYEDGWLLKLSEYDDSEYAALLDTAGYQASFHD